LVDQMSFLEQAYDGLGAYAQLYDLYNSLSSNYTVYMGLMLSQDPTNIGFAQAMIDGDLLVADPVGDGATDSDLNGLTGTEELALKTETLMMPIDVYVTYLMLQGQYAALGITNPRISKSTEYNTFIKPIKIIPATLQNGAMLMGVGVDQAKAGIPSGAESIFDLVLMMEGFEELQKLSYEMAVDTLTTTSKKYELGQISEVAYKTAVNDEKIALLNYQSMQRDVENWKMQLNTMLGQPVTTPLALIKEVGQPVVLEPLEFYINRGLKERAEIRNNRLNRDNKTDEMKLVEKYLGTRSMDFKRGDYLLKDYALELSYVENDIKADVMNAYVEVQDKEENYRIMKLTMDDALRQQSDMQLNVELGFVTTSMAKGLDIMVASATNDTYKAYRDYMVAVSALEQTSTIGPVAMGGF